MAKGKQTLTLTQNQINRLRHFKNSPHEGAGAGYSFPQLKTAMSAPFGWETLKKALHGQPIWDLHHNFITQWIDRYLPDGPHAPAVLDRKSVAIGEHSE